jgi:CheY-like chemotaxis protein
VPTRVLVLEDDPISRLFLVRNIEEDPDFEVVAVSRGETAIETAEKQRFDILLADIYMDGIDGIETATRISERQQITVIFLTARTDPETRARAQAARPLAIFSKPTDIKQILATMRPDR